MMTRARRARPSDEVEGRRLPQLSLRRWGTAPVGQRAQWAAAAVLVIVAAVASTFLVINMRDRVPDGAVFKAGDETVTVAQLNDRVRVLGALYGVQAPSDPRQIDTFRRSTAKAIAISTVIDHEAAAEGIVVADKQANDELSRLVQANFPNGEPQFTAQLGQLGVSQEDVFAEIKRQLENGQLYDKVTKDVPVPTDQEVTEAYSQRRAQMATPEQRHLRNIVVATQQQATDLRAQLDKGADFAAVAASSSLDGSTKGNGGDLGSVTRDQLEQGFGDAAFATPANGFFGPVQTQHGWNVGQTLEIKPSVPLTLDQVREQLRSRLSDERRSAVWASWLNSRIDSENVHYAADYQPADPLARPDVSAPK